MIIKLLAEGGAMKPGPALSQKLGPAGINVNQVIQKVNEATSDFKGIKVPVELNVNPKTRDFEVIVFSPPVSELLKRELKIEKGSGIQKKLYSANASIEEIISVAKTKFPNMLCNDLKAAVKSVVGTCTSLGVLVESTNPTEVEKLIDEGKYDKEINEEITECPEEKKKELQDYFSEIRSKQEQKVKVEESAKEAEAEKKEAKKEATPAAKKEEPKKK